MLVYFVRRRHDAPFPWVFWLFGAFILGCGTTHLMEVVTTYYPAYRLAGLVKAFTAAVSVATAVALVPIIPRALSLRGPEELAAEIDRRKAAEEQLRRANVGLKKDVQERTAELVSLNAQLRLSEAQLRQMADAMPQIVWVTRPDGYHEYYNRRWYEFTGLSEAESLGHQWSSPLHEDDRGRAQERWQQSLRTGEPYEIEYRFRGSDGNYRWFLGRALPSRDEAGQVVRWFGTCTDIDEKNRAEEELARANARLREEAARSERAAAALRRSEERLDLVVRSTDLGLWYCDLPFDRLTWNATCKEHFGLPASAEVTIDTFYECLHPDDRERTRQAIEGAIQFDAPYDITYRTVAPGGAQRWVRAMGRSFRDREGKPIRFDGVSVDVTQQKRVEAELRENDRLKTEFLAMLAHELRNPLAPIRNALYFLRLQRRDGQSDEVRDAYVMMERQVEHLIRLVDDLLDVSRITRGKITLRKEPVDLATVVSRAVECARPLIDSRGHTLEMNLPAGPLPAEGDPVRLTQVVLNLLNNAARYTARGGRVELTVEREGRDGAGWAVLRVRDNGIGIPGPMLPRVFDLFTQVDRTVERAEGGLGIGLTLVRELTGMHGGTVEAHSAGPGRGSEFVVRLPITRLPLPPSPQPAGPVVSRPAGRRVLVIDDNRDAANSLAKLLRALGHEVRAAHEGRQGLAEASAFRPEVVVLDLGMPGMTGFEVARHLREMSGIEQPLLVALTGFGTEDDRRQTREAGFDAHLVKPVDLQALTGLLAGAASGG